MEDNTESSTAQSVGLTSRSIAPVDQPNVLVVRSVDPVAQHATACNYAFSFDGKFKKHKSFFKNTLFNKIESKALLARLVKDELSLEIRRLEYLKESERMIFKTFIESLVDSNDVFFLH